MLPTKKRLMIDIETTALGEGAAVWEIGYYQMGGSYRGLFHLNPYKQNREINPDTVAWLDNNAPNWKRMQNIFPVLDSTKVVLEEWANVTRKEAFEEVWCKGSDFDFKILRHLFNQLDIELPWHYRFQCCMRGFLNTWPEYPVNMDQESHNAYVDSERQAQSLEKIMKHVGRY